MPQHFLSLEIVLGSSGKHPGTREAQTVRLCPRPLQPDEVGETLYAPGYEAGYVIGFSHLLHTRSTIIFIETQSGLSLNVLVICQTNTLKSSADEAVKWVAGPGAKPRLTPQEKTALSAADLEQILKLIALRRSLPSGTVSRKQRLSIGTQIFQLRHPSKILSPEKAREVKKAWAQRNPQKKKQAALDWYYRNRPPLKNRILSYSKIAIACRMRRIRSIQFRLAGRLRATLNRAFRRQWIKKPLHTEALLGCTIEKAKAHLESQFVNGMAWNNRGSFHIDHWIPVSAFDLRDSEEVLFAFNWQNLRPLAPHDNQSKQASIPNPLPRWLPFHIAERILLRHRK